MDQGLAAIVAGGAGLVGAVIGAVVGAWAAVRGARIGGEKAVEAAQLQVDGQAASGHIQWVRGQRQQAYAALLEAHSAVEETLLSAAAGIGRGGTFSTGDRDELRSRVLVMQSRSSQVALWGPEEVTLLTQLLRAKTIEAAQALTRVQSGTPREPGELDERWARWEQDRQDVANLRTRFLERAGEAVRDPSQPVT